MAVPFFDLKRQYLEIKDEINPAMTAVEESCMFILGGNVSSLEKEIAEFCGVKHGIGCASGTDALHLSLAALKIGQGDEVITSPFTFVATTEAVQYVGATPVFVDIEPETYNIDPKQIEKKITKKTKAIMPVHLYGQSADMDPIMAIAKKHNLKVIEDAAQALGSEYKGKKVCSIGDTGCVSFFPTKNLGAFGDGGMALTNSDETEKILRMIRVHGASKVYHYDILGFNSRLDELQAAVLRVKFKRLTKWMDKRRKNAALYDKLLKDIDGIKTPKIVFEKHVFNQYTIRAKDRDGLMEFLRSKKVGCAIYYPKSLHLQKLYEFLGYKPGDFKESEKAEAEVLSLPIFPELTDAEIEETASAIKAFYS